MTNVKNFKTFRMIILDLKNLPELFYRSDANLTEMSLSVNFISNLIKIIAESFDELIKIK